MDNRFYTPVLGYMQSEELALRNLKTESKKQITPMIQLVQKFRTVKNPDGTKIYEEVPKEKLLKAALMMILKCLGDYPKIYFDPRPLYSTIDRGTFTTIFNSMNGLFDSNIVPVLTTTELKTGNFSDDFKKYINEHGICLRFNRETISKDFWMDLCNALSSVEIPFAMVDLVFDYAITDDNIFEHFHGILMNENRERNWRSLTLISGAFQKDLIGMTLGTNPIARSDWLLWKRVVSSSNDVGYGDYLTQYPHFTPIKAPTHPSRSIRYTRESEWLVMKGESDIVKGSEAKRQYFVHATILKNMGCILEDCCVCDDELMRLCNDPSGGRGGFKEWRIMTMIHHLSLTSRQISKMFV